MKCNILAYQKGDALRVEVQNKQENEAKEFALFFDDIRAYSLCVKDKILGVFGYEIDEDKYAYCYALFSEEVGLYLGYLIKFIRAEMAYVCAKYEVKKVMMTVKKDFIKAGKFARLLGFFYRQELPGFYNNEDYQLFERN